MDSKIWPLLYQQFNILSTREKNLVRFTIERCANIADNDELKREAQADTGGSSWSV